MEQTCLNLLKLVRAGITGKACSVSDPIDWDRLLSISQFQGISSLIYRGIRFSRGTVIPPDNILTILKSQFLSDIKTDRFQRSELSSLFSIFDKRGFDYLPLKGTVMKDYYPSPELRTMSDADILIRLSQYDKIAEILRSSGFRFEKESDHELKWTKGFFVIEFHKVAFDPKYTDSADYFASAFINGSLVSGTRRYTMDPTDTLVYSIAHYAKHFVVGGTRLRSLIDIYYLLNRDDVDEKRLDNSLADLNLTGFFRIAKDALDHWFGNLSFDNETELLFKTMMSESYEYNLGKCAVLNVAREFKGESKISPAHKVLYFFKRLFPPLHLMKQRYKILIKLPFLLPVFWIWRIVSTVFFGKGRIRQIWDIQVSNTSEVIDTYMQDMKMLHLENIAVPEEL